MDRTPDKVEGGHLREGELANAVPSSAGTGAPTGGGAPRVLLVASDGALVELLKEWLAASGFDVVAQLAAGEASPPRVDLAVVDVPFPRQGGLALVQRLASDHPGTPIIALSSNFFPGIEAGGAVARTLGVARVLPVPVTRGALVRVMRQLLRDER